MVDPPIRLLLVEDAPADARLVREALSEAGRVSFKVSSATTLEEAIELLEGGAFEVCLLDLGLPDARGVETVDRVLEVRPGLAVVVLTGSSIDEEVGLEATRRGAQAYLSKHDASPTLLRRTARHALERAHLLRDLAASRAVLSSIVDRTRDGYLIVDGEGCIRYANPSARRLLDRDDPVGDPLELVIDEDRPREVTIDGPAGRSTVLEVRADPTEWHDRPARLVSLRDVTEHRQLENQVAQAQKMEAVGRLAGGVAHDFNNLLTVIGGYVELVLEELPDDAPGQDELEAVLGAAERAAELTRQLLTLGRREVLETEPADLNETVDEVETMLRRVIGEDIEVSTSLAPDLPPVEIDPGRMEQVILNLALNARDAMPRGGSLDIETESVRLGEEYAAEHLDVDPGEYVRLSVSDTGVGMDAGTRQRIFEPFFSTKGEEGTGLGLATTYGIVKQFDGDIWVYSEPGEGTTFKIYLPVVAETEPPAGEPVPEGEPGGGTETVLVVEDEEAVRALVVRVLEANGYEVIEAPAPHEAMRLAEEHRGPVDLLLTDVVLPEMTGPDLADILGAQIPGLRRLFLSGYTARSAGRAERLDGDEPCLDKPFSPSELLARVRAILDG